MSLDVAAIERATLLAVPPQRLLTLDGWLVGIDDGTVGRAHSAVPTRHEAGVADGLDAVLEAFASAGRPPVFRVPQSPAFDGVRQRLQGLGMSSHQPTLTMSGTTEGLAAVGSGEGVEVAVAGTPGDDWAGVFLGEGFDPVDGASRLAILRRSRVNVFASVRVDGALVAVGSASLAEGWCGVHGMRTARAFRGRGYASAILARFGRGARERGIARAFLQVDQANLTAQSLYRRAGFDDGFVYAYWKR
jgi:ribosomal protein S18 acetylase RimI-like enzyme